MNRKDRRSGMHSSKNSTPFSIMLHCPGANNVGCPANSMIAFVVGFSMRDAFTLEQLHNALDKEGWRFAICKGDHEESSQKDLPVFDPICSDCVKILSQEMVDSSGGNIDPNALPFIRKTLGSEYSS